MKKKNKTGAWIRLITSSILLLVLTLFLIAGITGGGFNIHFFGSSYPNEERYTVGNNSIHATELEEIEINWISGSVKVDTYKGDTIEVSETYSGSLSTADYVRSLYEDGKLLIQFRESRFLWFGSFSGNKALHLRIPEALAKNIKNLSVDSVSSDNTLSGLAVQNCDLDNVSGQIHMEGAVENFNLDTVSGDCQLTSNITPKNVDSDSVSGDFTLIIPDQRGFSIEHDTVSGKISSDFSMTRFDDDEYIFGDGGTDEWKFDSVSGDIYIQKYSK